MLKSDHVEARRLQWKRELPDLDTTPMAIFGRMMRISHLMHSGIEGTFQRYGLDRGEFDVIATLRRAGPPYRLAPTDLYKSLMLSSGGMTHRLGRLEKMGLISREKSPEDGRSLLVVLTPGGREKAEAAFREDMASELDVLTRLPADKLASLEGLLKDLLATLEDESGHSIDTRNPKDR